MLKQNLAEEDVIKNLKAKKERTSSKGGKAASVAEKNKEEKVKGTNTTTTLV